MRVRKGSARTRQRKRMRELAKGYYRSRSHNRRIMKDALLRTGRHAYTGRKQRKRDFRSLWISRIRAALLPTGINYSRFMNGLTKSGVALNRKMLAEMAVSDPPAFQRLVEVAKAPVS